MIKNWQVSGLYFINTFFHIGVLWVFFTVAVPNCFTIQEHIVDIWGYADGKESIILLSLYIVGNLIFAVMVLFLVNRSQFISIALTCIAWLFICLVYWYGYSIIYSYIIGAIILTIYSAKMYKNA